MKTGLVQVTSNCKGLGSLYIIYQGSALNEQVGTRGISHLAEHLACKSYQHLENELQAAGIVSNAYTSDDHIAFFWSGLNRKIEEFQKELLNLTKYIPNREDFEKEKLIVLQEYNDHVSDQSVVYSNIQRKYLNYFGPIGYKKDIEEITYEQFLEFMLNQFMRPTSIIRIGESESIVEDTKFIQYMPLRTHIDYRIIPGIEDYLESSSSFDANKMVCDWTDTSSIDVREVQVILRLWSDGLNSPLYQEIREKRGLVYGLGMFTKSMSKDVNLSFFNCSCSNNEEEVRKVFKETISNVEQYITKERFDIILEKLKCLKEKEDSLNYSNIDDFITYDWEYVGLEYLNGLKFETILESAKNLSNLFLTNYKEADYGKVCRV